MTFFAGVPTMYWGLLGALTEKVDVDKIAGQPAACRRRRLVASRSRSSKQVKERFHVEILEGYGLSETSPVATFSQLGTEPRPAPSGPRSGGSR